VSLPDNLAANAWFYLFTPMLNSLNGLFLRGSACLFNRQTSAWAVRGSSEVHYSPCKELCLSSAHLESGTALTDEGLLLGNMAFRSVMSRPAWVANFGPWIRRVFIECAMII
jgi:hypothetical protein